MAHAEQYAQRPWKYSTPRSDIMIGNICEERYRFEIGGAQSFIPKRDTGLLVVDHEKSEINKVVKASIYVEGLPARYRKTVNQIYREDTKLEFGVNETKPSKTPRKACLPRDWLDLGNSSTYSEEINPIRS